MAAQIYSFKICYSGCNDKIWRNAAVSSNYTLAQLGYLILASFNTMAYHLFDIKYKDTTYVLTQEDLENIPCGGLLTLQKIGKLGMCVGDVLEMTYDFGCCQVFEITLLEISDMPKGCGRAYPKILDGAGRGIVDDMSAEDLAEAIRKIDLDGHSGIHYSSIGFTDVPEWDYREYSIDVDNMLLRALIKRIRDGFENGEDDYYED